MRRTAYRFVFVSWMVPCPPLQAFAAFLLTFWIVMQWGIAGTDNGAFPDFQKEAGSSK